MLIPRPVARTTTQYSPTEMQSFLVPRVARGFILKQHDEGAQEMAATGKKKIRIDRRAAVMDTSTCAVDAPILLSSATEYGDEMLTFD